MDKQAMSGILKINNDEMEIRKLVELLLHLLYDYIPRNCIREVEDKLWDEFEKQGIELTTKLMRKEYEAWKSLQIEGLEFMNVNKEIKE